MKLRLSLVLPCAALVAGLCAFRSAPQGRLDSVRDELVAVNAAWDRARTGFDAEAFERMLAPDFWVQIGTQKLTRAEFIAEISQRRPGLELARFDTEILTLAPEGKGWVAVVEEKLEVTAQGPDGATKTSYSLWITRDRFRKDGEHWLTLSSEAIGFETWSQGERPPFDDWDD